MSYKDSQTDVSKVALSLTLSSEMSEKLKEAAVKQQISQAVLIRQALQAHLEGGGNLPSFEFVTKLEEKVKTLENEIQHLTVEIIRAADRASNIANDKNQR